MARSRRALAVLAVTIASMGGGIEIARGAELPLPRPPENVDPAVLAEVGQYVYGLPGRLAEQFPEAYAGARGSSTAAVNDGMVIRFVEGAPGLDAMKAEVDRTRQYSLERTGRALVYTYEPAPISRARRIEVHTGLAADLETGGPLSRAGLLSFTPGDRGFTLQTDRGRRRAVASQARSLYPGVPIRVQAVSPEPRPSRRACSATTGDQSRAPSSSAAGPLRTRLELTNRCLSPGSTVEATVVVENDTGQPLEYRMCGSGSPYQARLVGEAAKQDPGGWLLCRGAVQQIPLGRSRWPVQILAFFTQCSQPETVVASMPYPPGCIGHRPPSLPSASYEVLVNAADEALPIPRPVKVWIVR